MFDYLKFDSIKQIYHSLYDDLSKVIFLSRLAFDLDSSKGYLDLAALSGVYSKSEILQKYQWISEFSSNQTPVFLYGAGARAKEWHKFLLDMGVNIQGFLDKRYPEIREYCGLPVYPPQFDKEGILFKTPNSYILIATAAFQEEIFHTLCDNGFDSSRILPLLNEPSYLLERQYFDFSDKIPAGGAIIDAGSMDCSTSLAFSRKLKCGYSKIYAFEPDPSNYHLCLKNVNRWDLKNINVVCAGLGKKNCVLSFSETNNGSSHVDANGSSKIKVVTLDSIVKDEKVSFIKMDIEGAELDAIIGASATITANKPFCAISVYHKPGDMLVLASALKEMVPDYTFALRHYSLTANETVLYAFI